MTKFIDGNKQSEKNSRAFKMVEDEEDDYTDVEEASDEEDSNSEPSDDNLSANELEQWYQKIKKTRECYFKKKKLEMNTFNHHNVRTIT